ncbi:cob(I)yrinic acid a,c-diamide adenosyltransferase [Bacillus sp. JCM 19041]|uniref:cob(I)yrinic acid a,c-diamide adenosyltransferase n=1 Tax=Bacillus sp. JCM 19041 TaxID=1460637 RepID=UPI0006CF78A9
MKIYTKGGDKGRTSLIGKRVDKTDARIEAIGAIDELNSSLGMAVALVTKEGLHDLQQELLIISHQLFDVGADLANNTMEMEMKMTPEHTKMLEIRIDHYTKSVGPLKQFILPGGSESACALHRCRTDARRAERKMSVLDVYDGPLGPYINRLSDYFFTVARLANAQLGVKDVPYEGSFKIISE